MLFAVKFLWAFMSIMTSGMTQEASRGVTSLRAASLQAEFKDHLKWAKENLEKTQQKVASLQATSLQQEEKGTSSCSSKCSINKNLQTPAQIPAVETHTNQEKILIFVSFSMPEASLKALAKDARGANAVLIIRGLIDDSFKVTAERLKDYPQGMEVNPELFEKYNIQHVPTFVRVKGDQEQTRLSGNVTLSFAAQKLGEDS